MIIVSGLAEPATRVAEEAESRRHGIGGGGLWCADVGNLLNSMYLSIKVFQMAQVMSRTLVVTVV